MDIENTMLGSGLTSPKLQEAAVETREEDILTALLEAASYEEDEAFEEEIEIRRNKKKLFSFRVHPVSDEAVKAARKKATTYMKNPNNKKLPPIEKEFRQEVYRNWLIYLATIPEDQKKIWGNEAFMRQKDCVERAETVGKILMVGETINVVDRILEISGFEEEDEDEQSYEEYVKN